MSGNLLERETHFDFGRNWRSFVDVVSEARIERAVADMRRLFPDDQLRGKRFLDIGCGSGLSMLAALRLGAKEAIGVDIDEDSVCAAQTLLARAAAGARWKVIRKSVFELDPEQDGRFDVVHSWGVLHHTGDMWRAVAAAGRLVDKRGVFAIALYRKTTFCALWKLEKRIYSTSPGWVQAIFRLLFKTSYGVASLLAGDDPWRQARDYAGRGMDWSHDVHDWLGGYPYESATPDEVHVHLRAQDFRIVREFVTRIRRHGSGLFGSQCDEYVAMHADVV